MKTRLLILLLLCTGIIFPQRDKRLSDPLPKEFQFIGYSFTRFTASNVTPTNDILQGQVIGRLFGQNSTNVVPQTAIYGEQRFVPFMVYKPSILDGFATFRALFKIDYTIGDQAYGVGGNRGGGLNGGYINLQTLLANVDLRPDSAEYNVVIGMQRLFDNVRDPNVNTVPTAQTSGYKLSFWGTQAVGINAFGKLNAVTSARLGFFQLWENEIRSDDDVYLWMFDIESRIHPLIEAGADFWWVYDHARGAGSISTLGQGLNSALAEYNGAVRIGFDNNTPGFKYTANVFWAGAHASYNRDFLAGRWWADAFVMANFGSIDTLTEEGGYKGPVAKAADIFGVTANGMAAYKYGMTANDKVSVEAIYTTGDDNGVKDGTLNSVITGNVYGSPVGIYSSHRALLLFPDPQVVNRYYSAVHDISNMGLGVFGVFANFSKDFIPNKFSGKLGFATAYSVITPSGGSSDIGTEVNVELKYNLKVFLTLGLSAGYMKVGGFYDSPKTTYVKQKPKDPFVVFTSLSWMMF